MQNIPLQAIPNQSFSLVIDNNNWDIEIKTTNGSVAVSLTLNNVPVIANMRAVGGVRIIPSKYEEAGNFAFICLNQNVPDYTQFGITQSLIYGSADELESARVAPAFFITAASFDPLGAIPLRFAPQGYMLAP